MSLICRHLQRRTGWGQGRADSLYQGASKTLNQHWMATEAATGRTSQRFFSFVLVVSLLSLECRQGRDASTCRIVQVPSTVGQVGAASRRCLPCVPDWSQTVDGAGCGGCGVGEGGQGYALGQSLLIKLVLAPTDIQKDDFEVLSSDAVGWPRAVVVGAANERGSEQTAVWRTEMPSSKP